MLSSSEPQGVAIHLDLLASLVAIRHLGHWFKRMAVMVGQQLQLHLEELEASQVMV